MLHLLSRKANVLGFISFILFHICVIVLFSWASRGMDAVHTFIILPVVFENSPPLFQEDTHHSYLKVLNIKVTCVVYHCGDVHVSAGSWSQRRFIPVD